MSDKNIEIMKQIIEEKKKKSSMQKSLKRAEKKKGTPRKGFNNTKSGGVFDK